MILFVRQASGLSIPTGGIVAVATTYPHVAQASWPARKLYAPPRAASEAPC
jgi:hypothetical protein